MPVVDAPPPPVAEAAPLPSAPSGYGITPVLFALGGIATIFALFLADDDDDDFDPAPVSVN